MSDDVDPGCCCGCCLGLALGYILLGAGEPPEQKQGGLEQITEIRVEQQDGFLLRKIDNYQANISPVIRERLGTENLCRFEPSCSEYAKQAIEKYGPVKGSVKATGRLMRCNPLSSGGYDPVE